MEELLQGTLLLKQEVNGLHLRWVAIDKKKKFIFWLNPKKDVLIIEKVYSIRIDSIKKVTISADAKAVMHLGDQISEMSPLSLWFSVEYSNSEAVFYSPSKTFVSLCAFIFVRVFDKWIEGLSLLIGENKIVQEEIPDTDEVRSLEDVKFLQSRLSELTDLQDSLLEETVFFLFILGQLFSDSSNGHSSKKGYNHTQYAR
jgi:hypothetical protein